MGFRLGVCVLISVAGLDGCASELVRPAPFHARPDSILRGDLRGPFDGRVMDAETDRPVGGALVYASWAFVTGLGLNGPAGWHDYVGSTDANGYYTVPRLEDVPGAPKRLSDFHLIVYKRGYVAFRSDRRFDDFGPRTDFTQQGYLVALQKWRPELSHARHLRYVGGGATLAELTSWEVSDAVAELGGGKPTAAAAATQPATAPGVQNLDAARFLRPADVKKVTNFDGAFDVSNLGDEPSTPEYDSVHLQARGKDETFDVAMRVWHFAGDEASKHFDRLAAELPGTQLKNEIGDKSLRAATPQGDIFGVGFLDAKRGVVVLIQCGSSQCRSHAEVLALVRIVKERTDAAFAPRQP
jgi:hypothetical protein